MSRAWSSCCTGLSIIVACVSLAGACSEPASINEPSSPRNEDRPDAVVEETPEGGAAEPSTLRESRVGPIGLAALGPEAFARLAHLRTDVHPHRDSSFDRKGENRDYALSSNFLYRDDKGDQVYVDQRGPGCLYRIWMTQPIRGGIGFSDDQLIHFYFDDEPVARVSMKLAELFSGKKAPFLAPLVGDAVSSSGGFFSLLPMPFAKALRVTVSNATDYFYYQFDTHRFDPSVLVTTWTGEEDSTKARALLSAVGADPKPRAEALSTSATLTVPPGASVPLLDVDGPGSIASIHLGVAGVFPVRPVPYTDGGRAFGTGGSMRFTMKIDPANEGVVLQRRLDHGIPDQKARVFVDGQLAGVWWDRGVSSTFRDNAFAIPESLTAKKNHIAVKIEFESSGVDWNAFYFWAFSRVRGADKETDALDVGVSASEVAHAFVIEGETFAGTRSSSYPSPEQLAGPLRDLWIRMTWDREGAPAVEAPFGSFFAVGDLGPGFVQGLATGMHPDGILYAYWPMPYAEHAKLELVNKGSLASPDVFYDVRRAPFEGAFENVGYFSVSHRTERPSTPDADLVFLDTPGSGQIVGIVQTVTGPLHRGQLEGDTRAMLDERRTPALYGTGTEDEYSGGFYFDRGIFSLPTHGAPNHVARADDTTAMYRFFLPDVVPFRRGARFTAEHGPLNDVQVDASMLAYYYAKPAPRLASTDALVIGDEESKAGHGYTVTSGTFRRELTSTFEGEGEKTPVRVVAAEHRGESRFTLAVEPNNAGVVLRRVFDQTKGRQTAEVFVDGQSVGRWYAPGKNADHALREDELLLPASMTAGKSKIDVRVAFVSTGPPWSEIEYRAYSRRW